MKKIILIVLAAGIIIGLIALWYVFRPAKTGGVTGKPEFTLLSDSLVAAFDKNEDAANKTYNEKIIRVKGIIAEISKDSANYSIVLRDSTASEGVSCSLGSDQFGKAKSLATGKIIEIKGICFGKNLIDVSLNKCTIIEE
jgi:hypothetical protein